MIFFKIKMYVGKLIPRQNIDEKIKLVNEAIYNELNTYTVPNEVKNEISLLTEEIKSTVNSINSIADANNELINIRDQASQYAESSKTWLSEYDQLKPYIKRIPYLEKRIDSDIRKIKGIAHEYAFYLKNKKEKEEIAKKDDLSEILNSFSVFKK